MIVYSPQSLFLLKIKSHFYLKYSSTLSMILFVSSIARLAWSLVYAVDGIWAPSGYFISFTPWVRFSRSVTSRCKSLGSDRARLARFSERLTLLASSMYCQATKAFSVAFGWTIFKKGYQFILNVRINLGGIIWTAAWVISWNFQTQQISLRLCTYI